MICLLNGPILPSVSCLALDKLFCAECFFYNTWQTLKKIPLLAFKIFLISTHCYWYFMFKFGAFLSVFAIFC